MLTLIIIDGVGRDKGVIRRPQRLRALFYVRKRVCHVQLYPVNKGVFRRYTITKNIRYNHSPKKFPCHGKNISDRDLQKLLGESIIGADSHVFGQIRIFCDWVLKVNLSIPKKNLKSVNWEEKEALNSSRGHAIGITSLETIDFRPETVEGIYPGCNLHGILSPTTDLSREGIMAATTQIDAGYRGTLNWTMTNNSNKETQFLYGEKIYRLTIFLLEEGEKPEKLYAGDYQEKIGYIRSQRKGAPQGMRETEWEHAFKKDGPEEKIDEIINAGGYPWNIIGPKLKEIGQKFETVSKEYADIRDSVSKIEVQIGKISNEIPDKVRGILRDESENERSKLLSRAGLILLDF